VPEIRDQRTGLNGSKKIMNDALTLFSRLEDLSREKNLSKPAAAGFISLDASSGLLATASAGTVSRSALCSCGVSCVKKHKNNMNRCGVHYEQG